MTEDNEHTRPGQQALEGGYTLGALTPPTIAHEPSVMIDITKERELRQLRGKVSDLEQLVVSLRGSIVAGITERRMYEEQHGFKCGFHPNVTVSTTTKEVTCNVCGAELDPLDVLRDYARGERQFVESMNGLSAERRKLMIEVDELRKQRSSLRSQLKQIRKKAAP